MYADDCAESPLDDLLAAIPRLSSPQLTRIVRAVHAEEIRRALTYARDSAAERLRTFEEKQAGRQE